MNTLKVVNDLKDRARSLRQSASDLDAAVSALQIVCDHDWEETGYDPRGSSTTFYKCALCGAEKTE